MKPSRTSIRDLMLNADSAMGFKKSCKEAFGWTEKAFFNCITTNHTFNAMKNNLGKDWILKEIFNQNTLTNNRK